MNRDLLRPGWTSRRIAVGDVVLHVVEAGDPHGPLMILLHGFPESWWAWRQQIDPLAAAGFRVVVPDQRGYGDSDAPRGVAAYRLDRLADDVVAVADACGVDRFVCVGHDWGAVVTWWVAARHPTRVARAVVIDGPHPDTLWQTVLAHPTQALRSAYVAFFQLPWLPEAVLGAFDFALLRRTMRSSARPGTFTAAVLDRYAADWRRPGTLTAMLNWYRALRRRRASPPVRIAPPTLILWGGRDRFLGTDVARAGLALCDDGRLVIVDDATHWLPLEEPERVVREMVGFVPVAGPGVDADSAAQTSASLH